MHRLFVAARPPGPIRRQLLGLMDGIGEARWQDDDQLHITLRFIGEVDGRMTEDIALALEQVRYTPIETAIRGIGTFDRKGRPDALWAGLAPADALAALHRKIDHALVRIGLPPEGRAYHPHVTLARFSRKGGDVSAFAELHAGLASEPFRLDSFGLFESRLGRDGARYERLVRYTLG
jgi:2'-5' RNA ligase